MISKIIFGISFIFLFQCTSDPIIKLEGEWHISPNSYFEITNRSELELKYLTNGDTFSISKMPINSLYDGSDLLGFTDKKISASIKPINSNFLLLTLYKAKGEIDEVFIASKRSYKEFNENKISKIDYNNKDEVFFLPDDYLGRVFIVFDQNKNERINSSIGLVYLTKSKVDRLSYLFEQFNFKYENNLELCVSKEITESQNYIFNNCEKGIFLYGFSKGGYKSILNELNLEGEVLEGIVK